jgi:hypothetical protein
VADPHGDASTPGDGPSHAPQLGTSRHKTPCGVLTVIQGPIRLPQCRLGTALALRYRQRPHGRSSLRKRLSNSAPPTIVRTALFVASWRIEGFRLDLRGRGAGPSRVSQMGIGTEGAVGSSAAESPPQGMTAPAPQTQLGVRAGPVNRPRRSID